MSDVNLIKEADRGTRAKTWLEDGMTLEVFGKLRESIHSKWAESPIEDREGQHELRLMLKLLDTLHAHATDVAVTGEMARQELSMLEQAKQSTKRFLNEWGVRV